MSERYTDALGIRWSSKEEYDEWHRQAKENIPKALEEYRRTSAFAPFIVERVSEIDTPEYREESLLVREVKD